MRHNRICVIASGSLRNSNDLYLNGIEKRAATLGYVTEIFSCLIFDIRETGCQVNIFDRIDFNRYDGVIFFKGSFSAHKDLAEKLELMLQEKCKCPVVAIGFSVGGDQTTFPTIKPDSKESFESVTDHLIDVHGCQTIYCLGGAKDLPDRRLDGFRASLEKHNMPCPPEYLQYGGFWKECAEKLAKDIAYELIPKPDGIVCLTDIIALQLIKSLYSYGIKVPNDIIVAGFNGYQCSENPVISITTFPMDFSVYGEKAVTALHKLISGEEVPEFPKPMAKIITGNSCGCGRKVAANLRSKLDELDLREEYEMYFQNSLIEESFYKSKSYDELIYHIANMTYLIPGHSLFGFSLFGEDGSASCYYLNNSAPISSPVALKPGEILPESIVRFDNSTNYHVVPLELGDTYLGFAVVGYQVPVTYDEFFIRFCRYLSNALYFMKSRLALEKKVTSKPLPKPASQAEQKPDYIFIKKDDSLYKLPLDNIYYFESDNRKTLAYTRADSYETGKTLSELASSLSDAGFLRIAKSVVINTAKIATVHVDSNRTIEIVMTNKKHLHVSRNYCKIFKEKIM